MNVEYVFAGAVVSARDDAVAWYERLFGRPPDMLPNDDEATWRLTETASFYVVADPTRAGGGLCTIIVTDVAACADAIAGRGIAAPAIEKVGTAGRKLTLVDPDGNALSLVELTAGT